MVPEGNLCTYKTNKIPVYLVFNGRQKEKRGSCCDRQSRFLLYYYYVELCS